MSPRRGGWRGRAGIGLALAAWATPVGCTSHTAAGDAGGSLVDTGVATFDRGAKELDAGSTEDVVPIDLPSRSDVPSPDRAGDRPDAGPLVWVRRTTFDPRRSLPPRLVAPLSGWNVNTQRPTLKWVLPPELTRARVELCRDRACTMELRRHEVQGNQYRLEAPLAAGVVFWRVRGLDAGGQVRWSSPTWEMGIPHRDNGGDYVMGPLRDFDGDGIDDAAIELETRGEPRESPVAFEILFGARRVADLQQRQLRPMAFGWLGPISMGWSDLDGDARSELLLAITGWTFEPNLRPSLLWAASGDRVRPTLTRIEVAETDMPGVWFGSRSIACDFDGDGLPDLEVNDASGSVQTRRSSEARFRVTRPSDAETRLAGIYCAGDVNGDGYGDIVQPLWGRGSIYEPVWLAVLMGGPSGVSPAEYIYVPTPEDGFGPVDGFASEMSGGNDLDGDGLGDLVIGASGAAFVYYGDRDGNLLRRMQRLEAQHRTAAGPPFGSAIASGDYDGDGQLELTVSAPCSPSDHGCGWGQIFRFVRVGSEFGPGSLVGMGTDAGGRYGSGLASGDFNADGRTDLVISQQFRGLLYLRLGDPRGIAAQPHLSLPISRLPFVPESYSNEIAARCRRCTCCCIGTRSCQPGSCQS